MNRVRLLYALAAVFSGLCVCNWMATGSSAFALTQTAIPERREVDLSFERFNQTTLSGNLFRTSVPGGWLIALQPSNGTQTTSLVFVPDPNHEWNGKSLPRNTKHE